MNIVSKLNDNKKEKSRPILCLQRYGAEFKTVDGEVHKSCDYRFANPDALKCSIPEYIMYDIKNNGYIVDDKYDMYIINNIISIKWRVIEEKQVIDNFKHECQVFFSKENIDKMTEIIRV